MVVHPPPEPSKLSDVDKGALIDALWRQVVALTAHVEALKQQSSEPPVTPDGRAHPEAGDFDELPQPAAA